MDAYKDFVNDVCESCFGMSRKENLGVQKKKNKILYRMDWTAEGDLFRLARSVMKHLVLDNVSEGEGATEGRTLLRYRKKIYPLCDGLPRRKAAVLVDHFGLGVTLRVQIIDGPHDEKEVDLYVSNNGSGAALVGRSTEAKYRYRGLSLPRDDAISKSHGHFCLTKGKPFFIDTNSRNGTFVYQGSDTWVKLVPLQPLPLSKVTYLGIGATRMKVKVLG